MSPQTSIADVEGPWQEPYCASFLTDRLKSGWNTPIVQLSTPLLTTYLRQCMALSLTLPEARRRLATPSSDPAYLDLQKAVADIESRR